MKLYRFNQPVRTYSEATARDLLAAAEAYLEAHDWRSLAASMWVDPATGDWLAFDLALREQARREAKV